MPANLLQAAEPRQNVSFIKDFDDLWHNLAKRYCFFREKKTDWNAVRTLYRPQAMAARSRNELANILGRVLAELYDAHTYLRQDPDHPLGSSYFDSQRSPYFDLWVEPKEGSLALVTSVREGSAAADAGILPGDVITAVDGRPIGELAAYLMPRCLAKPDPEALAFTLNLAVSGRRQQPRTVIVRPGIGNERQVDVPLKEPVQRPDFEIRQLAEGFGCIVIRSFADEAIVAQFDAALLAFRDTPGLIIDVRENGGGDTAVARPIMGRFITERKPYARMSRREGDGLSTTWTEMVDARGPFTYTAPIVILTSRWSASMAEGFPMGMRGLGRATIVGTPMMRVGAAVFDTLLKQSQIRYQYSAEPVYDVEGRPRWLLEPDVLVSGDEDTMAAGIASLRGSIAKIAL
ncbi:S41 family peptidase [Blastomonas sp. SL216]|uniref:S41 family peptidase n=1 Tax=Blastomonas sp. SL216 TaxID=2995169 RepID=UPI002377A3DA|nr:S41 family peptidase [Blastomonas sp. SL216]